MPSPKKFNRRSHKKKREKEYCGGGGGILHENATYDLPLIILSEGATTG